MKVEKRCWFCGRTEEEVNVALPKSKVFGGVFSLKKEIKDTFADINICNICVLAIHDIFRLLFVKGDKWDPDYEIIETLCNQLEEDGFVKQTSGLIKMLEEKE